MVDGKTGLPNGNLDRAEERGFSDKFNIGFQGEPEIGEALHNAVVSPDKSDGALLARLEGRDRYQVFVPRAPGGRGFFPKAGFTALHVPVASLDQAPVGAPGRGIEHLAEGTLGLIG
jgi:hypothetical protein